VATDWNTKIIDEFRANEGRVGGPFAGAPVVLVHHRGRRSGQERVNPVMYLPDGSDDGTIYIFASKGGAPTNPAWYYNLKSAGAGHVERGTEEYDVAVRVVSGEERDRVFAEQAIRYPMFGEYERKAAGHRTIPVLALSRV
jgi:deazaflavin-dependent oxidoreductase (nitroreductase family)